MHVTSNQFSLPQADYGREKILVSSSYQTFNLSRNLLGSDLHASVVIIANFYLYSFFQGLTTLLPPPDSLSWGSLRDAFLSDERHSKNWDFYHTAINDHCECKRLYSNFYVHAREKANLYNDPKRAFHITFFEILQSTWSRDKKFGQRGKWSHGPLYDGTDNKRLAESAFTVGNIFTTYSWC